MTGPLVRADQVRVSGRRPERVATPWNRRAVGQNVGVDEYAAMERYLGRCLGLVIQLHGVLPPESLDEAQHLMEHGEPAEGVRALAWALVENEAHVPAEVVRDIRELTGKLILDEHMPAGLDACVYDE